MRRCLLAFSLLVLACSSASSSADPDATPPGTPPGAPPGTPPGTPGTDGGTDGSTGPVVLPACLGDALPIALTTGPHLTVKVGAAPSPYSAPFLIDFATTGSVIDMSSFGSPGPTASKCNPSTLGQLCDFADLDFFGAWGPVTLRTSTANILGTDFFAQGIYTLDYAGLRMLHAAKSGACADAALEGAGLEALSTSGFYANDLDLLKPQHDIDDTAPGGLSVANVPMVPVAIAGTSAIAQLDTGFYDNVIPHSINVNVAFYDAIVAAAPNALVRDQAHDVSLSTCAGVSEPTEAYTLAPGSAFTLGSRSFTSVTIFVKRTPPAAKTCGGIGTWSAPAAQIGNSFFTEIGALVFDPFTSRVWIAR